MPSSPPLIVIVGATATGKTAAAVRVAESMRGEIISADSMAVYRGMDIGTAKPAAEERRRVRFHVIDVANPNEAFSVSHFKRLALRAIGEIRERGNRPIVVGGTGLYVRALVDDLGLLEVPADPRLRARLEEEADRAGTVAMHTQLAAVDPEAADRIHPNDLVRIVRALEVWRLTGVTISRLHRDDASRRVPLPSVRIGLSMDRPEMDGRIDDRVNAMMAAGLVDEVGSLLSAGYGSDLPPMRSLGYREMCAYLTGAYSLPEAVEAVKKSTRAFARRQLTWFRADKQIVWHDVSSESSEQAANAIAACCG